MFLRVSQDVGLQGTSGCKTFCCLSQARLFDEVPLPDPVLREPCILDTLPGQSEVWRTVEVENIIFYLDAGMQTLSFQLLPMETDEPRPPTDRLVKKGHF